MRKYGSWAGNATLAPPARQDKRRDMTTDPPITGKHSPVVGQLHRCKGIKANIYNVRNGLMSRSITYAAIMVPIHAMGSARRALRRTTRRKRQRVTLLRKGGSESLLRATGSGRTVLERGRQNLCIFRTARSELFLELPWASEKGCGADNTRRATAAQDLSPFHGRNATPFGLRNSFRRVT